VIEQDVRENPEKVPAAISRNNHSASATTNSERPNRKKEPAFPSHHPP
jgi:hypothetical protein